MKSVIAAGKGVIRLLLTHAKLYINLRPGLRRIILAVLARFPVLARHIKRVQFPELADQTPRSRRIYTELKVAIESHRKENS